MYNAFMSMAVADAFCYRFEFYCPTVAEVLSEYRGTRAIGISDDTQMALFGLEALVLEEGLPQDPRQVAPHIMLPAYLRWYRTQNQKGGSTPLSKNELMHVARAPGGTCLSALRSWSRGSAPLNNSKGNGAVMRSLPFVFIEGTTDFRIQAAVFSGCLTHLHPESSEAVALYTLLATSLQQGKGSVVQVLEDFSTEFKYELGGGVHAFNSVDEVQKVAHTFTAMPALIAAMVALRRGVHEGFEAMMVDCCVNNADSDTVAAIAGSLWGLVFEPPAALVTRLIEGAIIKGLTQTATGCINVGEHIQRV